MKILVYKPGCEPVTTEIKQTLEAMQSVVGGYIETVRLVEDLILVCDEEGKLKRKPYNRVLLANVWHQADIIVGDFFVCRTLGDGFTSVHDGDAELAALFLAPV